MKDRKEYYKATADELKVLHESFMEAGFTETQAFELTSAYARQSMINSILRGVWDIPRKVSKPETIAKFSEVYNARKNKALEINEND